MIKNTKEKILIIPVKLHKDIITILDKMDLPEREYRGGISIAVNVALKEYANVGGRLTNTIFVSRAEMRTIETQRCRVIIDMDVYKLAKKKFTGLKANKFESKTEFIRRVLRFWVTENKGAKC